MTTEAVEPIDPSKTALLIMDYQNGIIPMAPNPEELLAGARQAIDLIRSHGGTIGYVRVGFADASEIGGSMGKRVGGADSALEHFHADHANTQIHADVAPEEGDIVVRKTRVGPFGSTDLHEQLQARGIDTLVLAGISTSGRGPVDRPRRPRQGLPPDRPGRPLRRPRRRGPRGPDRQGVPGPGRGDQRRGAGRTAALAVS